MITETLQKELRDRFNPDGSQLRNHQLKLLQVLIDFDEVCRDLGINYWLSSGNCLGAVRHGGFIPWDDDVDVEMLREDYDKLLHSFVENDQYVIQTHSNDLFYTAVYSKFRDKHSIIDEHAYGFTDDYADKKYKYRGLYIDLFCIEKTNKFICHLSQRLSADLIVLASRTKPDNLLQMLWFRFSKLLFFAFLSILRFINIFIPGKKLRHSYGEGFYQRERNIEDLLPLQMMPFEGVPLPVPRDVDSYLRRIYGNYEEIPPMDRIRKPHVYNVIYL